MRDELAADAQNLRQEIQASEEIKERERRSEFLELCSQKKSVILDILDERFGPESGKLERNPSNFTRVSVTKIEVKNCNGERSYHDYRHAIFIANGTVDTLAHLYFPEYFRNGDTNGMVIARLEEKYLNGGLTDEESEKFEYLKSIEVVALAHDLVQNFSLEINKDVHEYIGRNRRMREESNENETISQVLTILLGSDELTAKLAVGLDENARIGKFNLTFGELFTTVRATVPVSNFGVLSGGRGNLDVMQGDLAATLAEIPSNGKSLSWKDKRRFEAAFAIATSDLRELSGGPNAEDFMDSAHNLLREVKFGLQEYLKENAENLDGPDVQENYANIVREIVFWYGVQELFVRNQQLHFFETLVGISKVIQSDEFFNYMRGKYSETHFNRNANTAAEFFEDLKRTHGRFIYQVFRERYDIWESSAKRELDLDYVCGELINRFFDEDEKASLSQWYDVEKNRLSAEQKAIHMGSLLKSAQYKIPEKFVDEALVVTVKKVNSPVPA
ncbi:hypothetical protein A3A69_00845 [candidate division WWE3 bacterium RIFCSPLOWO2_01_FULL_37_15]|uniref:Uncharacterized protein n=1 Tax=candidate division WWE3 bacterium RIFCSPLOWO2_01_FULL_37_15 TaxID=1802622 RepID=A0A1F4UV53_UNCKA|nr:MAG: hypothetical protein A3A69_00845 [candidate division WWE3 bacterium RIFCSPLOWO2_01_FULL_37_15]